MRICIDVRTAHIGGIDTYATNLLSALVSIDTENDYFALYDHRRGASNLLGIQEFAVPTMSPLVWVAWNQLSLPRFLRKREIDVYHSVKQIGALYTRTKKALTIHDACFFLFADSFGRTDATYWRFMQRLAADHYDSILTVSNSARECIQSVLPISDERISVTYPGVDHERFRGTQVDAEYTKRVREKYSLPSSYIFWIGKMMKTKNVETLIGAYAILRNRGDLSCPLVLGGRQAGSYKSIVQATQHQGLEIGRDVHFCGTVDAEDLPTLYKLARVFAFPSTHEGFGIPPLEAMACGTPVVAAAAYSLPEVLGDAALFFEPTDAVELAHQIDRALTDTELRSRLINKGLQKAAGFTYEKCARQTVSHYRDLAAA